MIAPLLFASSVFVFTLALWPKSRAAEAPAFVEDLRAPRTLH